VLEVGTYAIRATKGAFADKFGNNYAWWTSEESFRFQVVGDAAVDGISVWPRNDTSASSQVMLTLSQNVSGQTGKAWLTCDSSASASELVDCGVDRTCGTPDDVSFALLPLVGSVVACPGGQSTAWEAGLPAVAAAPYVEVGGNSAVLVFDDSLPRLRRFVWILRAGSLRGTQNVFKEIPETRIEFLVLPKDFAPPMATIGSNAGFEVTIPADADLAYEVCWCNPHADKSLRDRGSAYTYQARTDFGKCSALELNASTVTVLGMPLANHSCEFKCRTCAGPECCCEEPDLDAICLPENLCREACDAEPDCTGYSVRWDGTPHCLLCGATDPVPLAPENGTAPAPAPPAAPAPSPPPAPFADWAVLEKVPGAACTDADDFTPAVSSLTVSKALAAVNLDYVVPPTRAVAIEVLIRPEFAPNALEMRLSVIPEDQPCGRSAPAHGVYANGLASLGGFAALAPLYPLSDDPMDRIPLSMPRVYRVRENRYCGNANKRLTTTPRFLEPFKCYNQCEGACPLLGGCTCNGYYAGFDSETSNSLCVPAKLCRQLCDSTPGCDSYEMHREKDRCFLNIEQNCDYHEDGLDTHPLYDLWIARHDGNQEAGSPYTSLENHTYSPDYDSLAAYSVDRLVFKDIEFIAGGTYKLCFCDRPPCASNPDFRITLGTVHASGVSAILQQPRLRTVKACVPLPSPLGTDVPDPDPGYRCSR